MSAGTLIAILTHPHGDTTRVDARRSTWRWVWTHLRQAVCGLHGHSMVLHCEPSRLRLRCVSCGATTPGWRVDVRPCYRRLQPSRAQIVRGGNTAQPSRARAATNVSVIAAALLTVGVTVASAQPATSPRLRDGNPPVPAPQAYGGGQVALALTVGAGGDVQGVELLRDTPPYTDALIDAIRGWRFAPATTNVGGRLSPAPAPVLVVGVFRAPTLYAAPAAGATPRILGTPAPALPDLQSFVVPAYPPNVTGDGNVVIEIELTRLAAARGYRVVSPRSGFDNAALDAVRAWRFTPPRAAELPDHLFVYAVLGFRTPVSP